MKKQENTIKPMPLIIKNDEGKFDRSRLQVVIGLMGPKGSGKDTIADMAIKKYRAKKIANAQTLKDLCAKTFRLPIEFFNSDIKDKPVGVPLKITGTQVRSILDEMRRLLPESVLPLEQFKPWKIGVQRYANREFTTPRELLQYVGTELMQSIYKDFHSFITSQKIKGTGLFFISDIRFVHESDYASGAYPLFYPVRIIGRNDTDEDTHISEINWRIITPFTKIDNSKSLNQLEREVELLVDLIFEDAEKKVKDNPELLKTFQYSARNNQSEAEAIKGSRFVWGTEGQSEAREVVDMDKWDAEAAVHSQVTYTDIRGVQHKERI